MVASQAPAQVSGLHDEPRENELPRVQQTSAASLKTTNGVQGDEIDGGKGQKDLETVSNRVSIWCGGCKKNLESMRIKGSIVCPMCDDWYCLQCAKIKKADLNAGSMLNRTDVFWSCSHCTSLIPLAIASFKTSGMREDKIQNFITQILT